MSGKHRTLKSHTVRRAFSVTGITLGMLFMPAAAYAGPNWDPIIDCESSGNPQAENESSTASGLLQITDPTWQDYGGKGSHAADASVGEQMRVAAEIYADRGLQPWSSSKSCWADASSSVAAPVASADSLVDVPGLVGQPSQVEAIADTHTVVSGDTLSELAREYGRTTAELRVDNQLRDVDMIRVGAVLEV